jgi:hypothetical protein
MRDPNDAGSFWICRHGGAAGCLTFVRQVIASLRLPLLVG